MHGVVESEHFDPRFVEILPSAFRTLKLGKLVGEPTGGFVIGTMGVRLIDGSRSREEVAREVWSAVEPIIRV